MSGTSAAPLYSSSEMPPSRAVGDSDAGNLSEAMPSVQGLVTVEADINISCELQHEPATAFPNPRVDDLPPAAADYTVYIHT